MSIVFVEAAPVVEFVGSFEVPDSQDLRSLKEVLDTDPLGFIVGRGQDSPDYGKPERYEQHLNLAAAIANLSGRYHRVFPEASVAIAQFVTNEHIDGISIPTYLQGHHTRNTQGNPASGFVLNQYLLTSDFVSSLRLRAEEQKSSYIDGRGRSSFFNTLFPAGFSRPGLVKSVGGICLPGQYLFFKNGVDLTVPVRDEETVPIVMHKFWSEDPNVQTPVEDVEYPQIKPVKSSRVLSFTRII